MYQNQNPLKLFQCFAMKNAVNAEFFSVKVWFTDQVSKPLETEDNVNLMLIMGQTLQNRDIQQSQNTENLLKDMAFCHLPENVVINMVKN